jgi:signal transduction histidine kinase
MDGMIRDLLDFTRSRLGSGIPVARAAMDMSMVCGQTVDEIMAYHPRCVVQLESSGDVRGEWDSARIAQALSNLIGNAYQHGAPDTAVTVGVRGGPQDVSVSIHNQGSAIEPGKLKDIFDPFRQLKPDAAKSHDLRSAGLGLYIAQAIVTAHDGVIDVASSERGTTFTVRLPRNPPRGRATTT